MSTFRNPVGPQPNKVYWRRRLVVGLAALAVIVIILLLLFQPRGGNSKPTTPGASPAPSTSSAPSATTKADPGAACAPGTVTLTATTDSNTYAAGVLPQLGLTLTNNGAAACTINAGSTQQTYLITSGSEQYWSSKDCQTAPVDANVVLKPNVPQSTTPIPWDRTRSSTSTCSGDRPPVPAGGATYHLNISLGDLKSNDVPFILN